MITCDLVDPAHASGQLEQPTDVALRRPGRGRNVTHPGRTETRFAAEQWCDHLPGGFVLRGSRTTCVARRTKAPSRTISPLRAELLQRDGEGRLRQAGLQQKPQLLAADPLKVGIFGVIGRDLRHKPRREALPAVGRDGHPGAPDLENNESQRLDNPLRLNRG